jgi:hypothetical protein
MKTVKLASMLRGSNHGDLRIVKEFSPAKAQRKVRRNEIEARQALRLCAFAGEIFPLYYALIEE